MHRDLLRLRKDDPLLGKAQRGTFDGAVLGAAAFVLRFFGRAQDDRLLIVNLGAHLHLDPAPEPLLAPPLGLPVGDARGRAKIRATAAAARRPSIPRTTGTCPPRPPSCSSPSPAPMNASLIRRIDIAQAQADNAREILRREWLITNGLGGYASGTISGMVSRRYHGLLIAALPAPFGRVVMLNHLAEYLRLPDGRCVLIGGEEPSACRRTGRAGAFRAGIPARERAADLGLRSGRVSSSKSGCCSSTGRTRCTSPTGCFPGRTACGWSCGRRVHFRPHEHDVGEPLDAGYSLLIHERRYEVSAADAAASAAALRAR